MTPVLFFLSGMMAFTGMFNLFLSRRLERRPLTVVLSFFALLGAAYTLISAFLYQSQTTAEYLSVLRWQTLFSLPGFWMFLLFVQVYTERIQWPLLGPSFFLLVATLPWRWSDPTLLIFQNVRGLQFFELPWGESLAFIEAEPSALSLIFSALYGLAGGIALVQVGKYHLKKRDRGSRWLLIAVAVFIAAALFDMVMGFANLAWPRTMEWSYFLFFTLMTVGFSHEAYLSLQLRKQLTIKDWLTEQSREGILFTDPMGHIQYANPAFLRMSGYELKNLQGQSLASALGLESTSSDKMELSRHFQSYSPWNAKLTQKKKEGSYFRTQISFAPVYDGAQNILGFYLTCRDITEEEFILERNNEIQRLNTLHRLTSGFAHDFRNILSVVDGHLDLLDLDLENGEIHLREILETSQIIRKVTTQAGEMVNKLLKQSLEQTEKLVPIEVNSTIKDVIKMLGPSLPSSVFLKIETTDQPLWIRGPSSALHQILFNLCLNAIEAMTIMREERSSYGGRLSISVREHQADKSFTEKHPEWGDTKVFVEMKVQDTGVGIPPRILQRLFEPFVTSKREQGGTGLGLSMIQNMSRLLKGLITVSSTVEVGSLFTLYFPLSPAPDLVARSQSSKKKLIYADKEG